MRIAALVVGRGNFKAPMVEDLFQLQDFAHRELFANALPWCALDQLEGYLEKVAAQCSDVDNRDRVSRAAALGAHVEKGHTIWLGPGTKVEPGAYLRGPLYIGAHCEIRHAAYLRGWIVAGDGCIFGHATEVVRSILLNGAKAPHFAYLGDSIIGNRVNLGAGTKCANLRFDRREITAHYRGVFWKTNRHKLGAILGDETTTGCNSYLNPGAILAKKSILFSPASHESPFN